MKAMVIQQYGDTSVFQEMDLPTPQVEPGHVIIKVAATSVNPLDTKIRAGAVPANPELPAVLHGDVAGIVTEVGEGVERFAVGDEVFGFAGGIKRYQGALADYMLADARLIAKKPENIAFAEAAALPVVFITAWRALIERAQIQPKDKVLIHAGTGGVGHVAIQLAKWAGAEVYTTVSTPEKAKIAKTLGADDVIFYRDESVEDYVARCTDGKGFDVVFDTVGTDNMDRSFQAAKISGTVATIAARSTHDLSPLHGKNLTLHVVFIATPLVHGTDFESQTEAVDAMSSLVGDGYIRPLLDGDLFSFEDVAKAHAKVEAGTAIGKVVLLR
ncbi:zinc-dependent alcohol dehydrogenase family protein [Oceanospirillum maris]|uniref:zinc-dependent alcohol dehydrogenase family protein n=1 Tax=Oceanospirillum maris TaxID=64977 RepID=UPI000404A73E|nr:zinc-dependent alcohol dehydrogenase family protein [Oceanospirillum maris]